LSYRCAESRSIRERAPDCKASYSLGNSLAHLPGLAVRQGSFKFQGIKFQAKWPQAAWAQWIPQLSRTLLLLLPPPGSAFRQTSTLDFPQARGWTEAHEAHPRRPHSGSRTGNDSPLPPG